MLNATPKTAMEKAAIAAALIDGKIGHWSDGFLTVTARVMHKASGEKTFKLSYRLGGYSVSRARALGGN